MEEKWNIKHEEITFEKQLGRGSFGEVWKGEYQGTPVAIKQLYEVDNTEMEKYFARELDALTRLNHPYIVQLLGMARTTDHIFIVTEFVENGDLHSKLIDPAWEFNWKRRLGFLKDVARAMVYLHNKGRMHRDLKSANLLVTTDWKTKVCDFGLARSRATNEEDMANMTAMTGTMEWMAPEICLGLPYDIPIDVFSFAMVIYEVIFRLPPPRRAVLKDYAFQPELYKPPEDTPDDLWNLLCECAQQDPSRRPTFPQILSALDDIEKPIPGKPDQSYDRERRKQRGRPAPKKEEEPPVVSSPPPQPQAPSIPMDSKREEPQPEKRAEEPTFKQAAPQPSSGVSAVSTSRKASQAVPLSSQPQFKPVKSSGKTSCLIS